MPEVNSVKLAVDDANAAGGISGSQITVNEKDDLADSRDTSTAIDNANAFVADPRVVAFIASRFSPHSAAQIPITNAAGLLECSATNTRPGLTKPRYGGADLRSAAPTRIAYIRLAPSDDIQGPAAATFAYNDLAARNALVIDDTSPSGRDVADAFQAAFAAAGGQTKRSAVNQGLSTADIASALGPLANAPAEAPIDVVYFGGASDSGGALVREAMAAMGFGQVPLVSWDGLLDGSGTDEGSYINVAGAAAAGSYATEPTNAPESAAFDDHYRAVYGEDPDPYSGAGYACTQVILEALRKVGPSGPSAEGLREAVRAYATDPAHSFDTVLGTVRFDTNGDSIQQFVTIHKVDMGANGGAGDWVILKQRDYGPPP